MKPVFWIGSSKKDLQEFPLEVQKEMGFALFVAQNGEKHQSAKPLKGFGGAGILEIVERFDGDSYRAVYTVRFDEAIFVLHCFQKKSRSGIGTSQQDMEMIRRRLRAAEEVNRQ